MKLNDISVLRDIFCFSYRRSYEQYKITRQVIGFDEIRVRYRKSRREIIHHIIIHELTENELKDYILAQSSLLIKSMDRNAFIQTIYNDLNTISPSHIQGMDITSQQLEQWYKHQV